MNGFSCCRAEAIVPPKDRKMKRLGVPFLRTGSVLRQRVVNQSCLRCTAAAFRRTSFLKEPAMRATPRTIALMMLIGLALGNGPTGPGAASAQPAPGPYPPPGAYPPPPGAYPPPPPQYPPPPQQNFTPGELVGAGHRFFGTVSRGLATVIETAVSQWGQPNGYVLGEEAGGAFFGGLRFGEGMLYTKNAGDLKVYWQGPTIGWDIGGEGARTMMLVYNLPATEAIYQRFAGIDGSAYFVGGFGMTALTANDVVLVPIRSGVGFRLGANVGYLKFTPVSTWNPF